MKNSTLISFLLAFMLPLLSLAQGWEKSYDDGFNEYVSAADRTLDGGVILAGTQQVYLDFGIEPINYCFLYKTDIDGNLQWKFYDTIYLPTILGSTKVLSISDGNFLMSSMYHDSQDTVKNIIRKIAFGGNVLWERILTSPNIELTTGLVECSDGGFLLLGEHYNENTSQENIGVAKLDSIGNLLWEKDFFFGDYPIRSGDILETSNEDIMFVGSFGVAIDSQDVFAKRLDSSGNILWEKEYNNAVFDYSFEIEELESGEFVVGGGSSINMIAENLATLQKIDSEGNQLWFQTYASLGNQFLNGLKTTPNGEFAIAGTNNGSSYSDFYLMKVDATGNELWTKTYGRNKNDNHFELLLSPENGYYLAGFSHNGGINLNNPNLFDAYLVKTDSLGNSLVNELSGNLFHDENFDCISDVNEASLSHWIIKAEKNNVQYFDMTDSSGNYSMRLDTGSYEITVASISPYWGVCDSLFSIIYTEFFDTIVEDIAAQAIIDCPLLDISISTSFLRRCFESTYSVQYCNNGTAEAEDAHVEIVLDPFMEFLSSSIPLDAQMGDTITFLLGDVGVGECESFTFDILLEEPGEPCDSIPLGQTHCVEAHIFPDSICLPSNNWSGASVEVDATCEGDSITFYIQNVGDAGTQPDLQYFVIEDDVILYEGTFTLDEGASETITVLTNGSTFRLEAEQEPNHPGMSMPSVSVEGCGEGNILFMFGFVNIFPQDDGDPFVDIDCRQNIGAYDPNDKMGFPLGYGDENYITRGQDIEYMVRFQNTGTDTAFNVVIRDQLSDFLDITSVRPGAASHLYGFDVASDGTLIFSFDNIMLPDSNINEAASHGFVTFKVAQMANLDLETEIYNSAGIYFDFNAPVITNETLHTIGENIFTISIDPINIPLTDVKVYPNPFIDFTKIEIEGLEIEKGEFKLYDVTGRLIRKEHFDSNNFILHKKALQAGMYFFTIENANQLIASGKIVAQ